MGISPSIIKKLKNKRFIYSNFLYLDMVIVKKKEIKLSKSNWERIMRYKNRYDLKSANDVITAYHKLIINLKLEEELKTTIKV